MHLCPQHTTYYHPYGQETFIHSAPFSLNNNDHEHSERQWGSFGPLFPTPGAPTGPPPGFSQQGTGAPTGPPPSFIPTQEIQPFAVDPGSIRRCLFRFTYVW